MRLGIPAGIGDASWLISKLITSTEWPSLEFDVSDGWPNRTGDLFKLLGKKAAYAPLDYTEILLFEKLHPYTLWNDICSNGFGRFLMQPNSHLEHIPLKDYLPDLQTDYHYKLKLPNISRKWYYPKLKSNSWIGISAASYRGAVSWSTWEMDKWSRLVKMLLNRGYDIAFLGGSWDDLTKELFYRLKVDRDRLLNLVGKTSLGEVCAIHKMLKYYIGFCSGLGIIRTVLNMPTMMLWPDHMGFLRTSWADPKDVESHRYVESSYIAPKDVFSKFKFQESIWR